jgi:3-oxoacyl-[acyl-carrier protein] reductase
MIPRNFRFAREAITVQSLTDKIAVITGAGRGIGAAIARAMAAQGAHAICVARTVAEIDAIAAQIRRAGGSAQAIAADMATPDSLIALYSRIEREHGGIDLLVANAGVTAYIPINGAESADQLAQWRHIIDVNLLGSFDSIRRAIPLMRARGGGQIIVVGSGAGHTPIPGLSAYCSSKAALWMLVQTLAEELRGDGIAINELIPGPVVTDMMKNMPVRPPEAQQALNAEWIKQPEDVVPLAMFLATQSSTKGPTGQSFRLNRRRL